MVHHLILFTFRQDAPSIDETHRPYKFKKMDHSLLSELTRSSNAEAMVFIPIDTSTISSIVSTGPKKRYGVSDARVT